MTPLVARIAASHSLDIATVASAEIADAVAACKSPVFAVTVTSGENIPHSDLTISAVALRPHPESLVDLIDQSPPSDDDADTLAFENEEMGNALEVWVRGGDSAMMAILQPALDTFSASFAQDPSTLCIAIFTLRTRHANSIAVSRLVARFPLLSDTNTLLLHEKITSLETLIKSTLHPPPATPPLALPIGEDHRQMSDKDAIAFLEQKLALQEKKHAALTGTLEFMTGQFVRTSDENERLHNFMHGGPLSVDEQEVSDPEVMIPTSDFFLVAEPTPDNEVQSAATPVPALKDTRLRKAYSEPSELTQRVFSLQAHVSSLQQQLASSQNTISHLTLRLQNDDTDSVRSLWKKLATQETLSLAQTSEIQRLEARIATLLSHPPSTRTTSPTHRRIIDLERELSHSFFPDVREDAFDSDESSNPPTQLESWKQRISSQLDLVKLAQASHDVALEERVVVLEREKQVVEEALGMAVEERDAVKNEYRHASQRVEPVIPAAATTDRNASLNREDGTTASAIPPADQQSSPQTALFETLRKQVSTSQFLHTASHNKIKHLETQLTTHLARVASLESELSTAHEQIETHLTHTNTLDSALVTLRETNAFQLTRIADLEIQLEKIEGAFSEHEPILQAALQDLSNAQQTHQSYSARIAELDLRLGMSRDEAVEAEDRAAMEKERALDQLRDEHALEVVKMKAQGLGMRDELLATKDVLERKSRELEGALRSLDEALAVRAGNVETNESVAVLVAHVKVIEQKLAEAGTAEAKLKPLVGELNLEISRLEHNVQELEHLLDVSRGKHQALEMENKNLVEARSELANKVVHLQNLISSLEHGFLLSHVTEGSESELVESELVVMETPNPFHPPQQHTMKHASKPAVSRGRLIHFEEKNKSLRPPAVGDEVVVLEVQVSALKLDLAAAEAEIAELRKQQTITETLSSEIQTLQARIASQGSLLAQKQTDFELLQQNCVAASLAKDLSEQQQRVLAAELARLQAAMSETHSALHQTTNVYSSKIDHLQREVGSALTNSVKTLQQREAEAVEASAQIAQLEHTIKHLTIELRNTKQLNASLSEQMADLPTPSFISSLRLRARDVTVPASLETSSLRSPVRSDSPQPSLLESSIDLFVSMPGTEVGPNGQGSCLGHASSETVEQLQYKLAQANELIAQYERQRQEPPVETVLFVDPGIESSAAAAVAIEGQLAQKDAAIAQLSRRIEKLIKRAGSDRSSVLTDANEISLEIKGTGESSSPNDRIGRLESPTLSRKRSNSVLPSGSPPLHLHPRATSVHPRGPRSPTPPSPPPLPPLPAASLDPFLVVFNYQLGEYELPSTQRGTPLQPLIIVSAGQYITILCAFILRLRNLLKESQSRMGALESQVSSLAAATSEATVRAARARAELSEMAAAKRAVEEKLMRRESSRGRSVSICNFLTRRQ
ncbi:hypothetical protein HDU98_008975 [Podochytrium sp. JEL0797]|nr:hypothetical protein HDU98_008975 [Podochytrium sp. JEL0797]